MIRFSIKWAVAGAVDVGMGFGIMQMMRQSRALGVAEIGIGLFFGGAMALPLAFSHLVAALVTVMLAKGQGFALQFGVFILLSLAVYVLVLRGLDRSMQQIGGVLHGEDVMTGQMMFFAASTVTALLCMALGSLRRKPV